ncbi:DUF2269 family protein [Pseudomonas sp. F1_0610]|uniref:DUF2269 family protein n=1 Tax=Pseudomonas sp. F1_0610 TaxID=3114284 RepID=UPI0039C090CF
MDTYLLIRIAHGVPAVLLIAGMLAHIIMLWRASSKAEVNESLLLRKIVRSARISIPAFMLLSLSLPISGWWMAHIAHWPLDLKWLALGIYLLPLVFILAALLGRQLLVWSKQPKPSLASKQKRWCLVWALLILLVLIAISAIMGAKPL